MCGISLYLFNMMTQDDINRAFISSQSISHRGPDNSNFVIKNDLNMILSFNRLMIHDLTANGNQPFIYSNNDRTVYCMCNGEIYNCDEIISKYNLIPKSNSDCECLLLYYLEFGFDNLSSLLNSEHACIIVDINSKINKYEVFISTDRFGIRPLFMGKCDKGIFFSSELTGIPMYDDIIVTRFKPRNIMYINNLSEYNIYEKELEGEYYNLRTIPKIYRSFDESIILVRKLLSQSVIKRLNSDVPIGAYLSGGLDSIAVCIEASNYLSKFGKRLKTFCVGLPGSDDQIYANLTAKLLNTDHTNIMLTQEEYINLIPLVIRANGSFDTTTTRASIGQLKGAMEISKMTNIKVLLSGDGSDELMFSYNDAYDCPTNDLFEDQTFNLLENIHNFDGLRAERCTSRFGLELRLPFLDIDYVNLILESDINHRIARNKISKPLLRYAYKGVLPDNIIFRPKVTFSDGVGSKENSTQNLLSKYFKDMYTDDEFSILKQKYLFHCPPETKEQLYYRETFCDIFGNNESVAKTIPYFWMPRFKQTSDPSAWFNE